MGKIRLEELEKSSSNDVVLVQKIKTEYRKIDPFEAFRILGEGNSITRIVEDFRNGKELQEIKLLAYRHDEMSYTRYEFFSGRQVLMSDRLFSEIASGEWYVKL